MEILRRTHLIIFLVLLTFTVDAFAIPSLVVKSRTNTRGNTEWRVYLSPDPASFVTSGGKAGGALAVEISFESGGTNFISANVNTYLWPHYNPGRNPFTSTRTTGSYVLGKNAFIAMGSTFLISTSPVHLVTYETQGTSTPWVKWGGRIIIAGSQIYTGSLVAQNAINNYSYTSVLNPNTGADSLTCETLKSQISSYCNSAVNYPSTNGSLNCNSRIGQAFSSCSSFGNMYAICADISYLHLRAVGIPAASLIANDLRTHAYNCGMLLP